MDLKSTQYTCKNYLHCYLFIYNNYIIILVQGFEKVRETQKKKNG